MASGLHRRCVTDSFCLLADSAEVLLKTKWGISYWVLWESSLEDVCASGEMFLPGWLQESYFSHCSSFWCSKTRGFATPQHPLASCAFKPPSHTTFWKTKWTNKNPSICSVIVLYSSVTGQVFNGFFTEMSHEHPRFTGGKLRLGKETGEQRDVPQGHILNCWWVGNASFPSTHEMTVLSKQFYMCKGDKIPIRKFVLLGSFPGGFEWQSVQHLDSVYLNKGSTLYMSQTFLHRVQGSKGHCRLLLEIKEPR